MILFLLLSLQAEAAAEILLDGRLAASGWIAAADGRVVSAAHALWKKPGRVDVLLASGERLKAERAGFDLGHDLALLRLPPREKPYPALATAPEPPKPGAELRLFGSPQFRHRLVLPGRVARAEPVYEYLMDLKTAVRVIYVAGASPPGTSGGCWVDAEGRVVANQSGNVTLDGHSIGVGFAAPADAIRRLLEAPARTADAGIAVEELLEHGRLEGFPAAGVLAVIVHDSGPAKAAGLAPRFLVRSVDGAAVETRDAFYAAVRKRKPGDTLLLDIRRKNAAADEKIELPLSCLEESP